MIAYARTDARDHNPTRPREFDVLTDEELTTLSLLIERRRSLPIYLGDAWRCYACGLERVDVATMARHILQAHKAAPFNEEDRAESMATDTLPD